MWKKVVGCAITGGLFGLVFAMTCYKIPLIFKGSYQIYPWQDPSEAVISNSPSFFLYVHLISALILTVFAGVRALADCTGASYESKKDLTVWLSTLHTFFCLCVMANCWNLGDLVWWQAIIANLSALGILTYLINRPLPYFLFLLTPIYVEIATYFMT